MNLLRRAEFDDIERREGVLIQDMVAPAGVIQLLDHHAERDLVAGNSTVFLGDAHKTEARIAIRLGDLVRHVASLVHLFDDVLGEIPIAELANAFQEQLLLVGHSKVHGILLVRVS